MRLPDDRCNQLQMPGRSSSVTTRHVQKGGGLGVSDYLEFLVPAGSVESAAPQQQRAGELNEALVVLGFLS